MNLFIFFTLIGYKHVCYSFIYFNQILLILSLEREYVQPFIHTYQFYYFISYKSIYRFKMLNKQNLQLPVMFMSQQPDKNE